MSETIAILERLQADWAIPRMTMCSGLLVPFRCSFGRPATEDELRVATANFSVPMPLLDLWRISNGLSLFEDTEYGQWGLRLFSVADAVVRSRNLAVDRPGELAPGDLVLGEFLGDSDLLLLRCERDSNDYGVVMAVLPLDTRDDWDVIAPNLDMFLGEYERTKGEKFWRQKTNGVVLPK